MSLDKKIKELASRMGQHSPTKPGNETDKKLSVAHLKERIAFNSKHIDDHEKIMDKGGTEKYNKDHIKHHEEQVKEDKKIIKERLKMFKKGKE